MRDVEPSKVGISSKLVINKDVQASRSNPSPSTKTAAQQEEEKVEASRGINKWLNAGIPILLATFVMGIASPRESNTKPLHLEAR